MPPPALLLDRLLDPVSNALTPEAARRLTALRADPVVQQRIDELAERCNNGVLSDDERSEYETLVGAANVIAILQAKARASLSAG